MFQLGRELRRLFKRQPAFAPPRDGLTGGNAALLELLDLTMLRAEAKACDVAAGRISVKDKHRRQMEQSVAWRELARRTGDEAALRKAATAAEAAALGFKRANRQKLWARARIEQGRCAALCAELIGDEGLNAAAARAFVEAGAIGDRAISAASRFHATRLEAISAIVRADASKTLSLIDEARAQAVVAFGDDARARIEHADLLVSAAERFSDERLAKRAVEELTTAAGHLDMAYEPLTWRRARTLHGRALVATAEITGETRAAIEGLSILSDTLDQFTRDHSPLDWAEMQLAVAHALQTLGEAIDSDEPFDRAIACYDRALQVLRRYGAVRIKATAGVNRALCVERRAERSADLHDLDEAEAGFRRELASADAKLEPTRWAVCQLALARIYEGRVARTGRDNGERRRAMLALSEAQEVFADAGLRQLGELTMSALERLRLGGVVHR